MITVREMVESVDREIMMRKTVYPRMIKEKKMTAEKADYEIRVMEAVRICLKTMPSEAAMLTVK